MVAQEGMQCAADMFLKKIMLERWRSRFYAALMVSKSILGQKTWAIEEPA
jgi:hypothetical protein